MDHLEIARESLLAQSQAISRLSDKLDERFQDAVTAILECQGRIIVSGMGKSGIIGKKMAATFASTGTPSFFMHPAEAFHGDLGMITGHDIIVLLSYSGETEEVIKLIPSLKRFGNRIIAMAGVKNSSLAKHADIFLNVEVEREVCPNNLAPTTSTLATMAMADALAVSLMHARDFQPMDFARYHPGGSLGRKLLTRVKDVMHTDVPTVPPDASLQECLIAMTIGRIGMVVVQEGEQLAGLITDGDIRRGILKSDTICSKANELMTQEPLTITENVLIADAEDIMREKKVRVLLVTSEAGEISGAFEIFD